MIGSIARDRTSRRAPLWSARVPRVNFGGTAPTAARRRRSKRRSPAPVAGHAPPIVGKFTFVVALLRNRVGGPPEDPTIVQINERRVVAGQPPASTTESAIRHGQWSRPASVTFCAKRPRAGGEPGLRMLVSAATWNMHVGIQTSSRRTRGNLTLEELL